MATGTEESAEPISSPPPPSIHEAELASGPSGAVEYGPQIDFVAAVARRKAGGNVVVRGDNVDANRHLAGQIESAVGSCRRGDPHSSAGRHALPHYQPQSRPPDGHTFYETAPTQSEEIAVKYFTPDLIARGQTDDSRLLSEVEALWDKRCADYNAYLASIRDELSRGLRQIEDNYYLHDAVVRSMGYRGDQFAIVLQLDTLPRSLLTFTYHLVGAPRIDPYVLPQAARSRGDIVEWQYDEIEKVEGEPPTWQQAILLSNGWEIVIHFRDVEVAEMQALLPTPSNDAPSWMPACLS